MSRPFRCLSSAVLSAVLIGGCASSSDEGAPFRVYPAASFRWIPSPDAHPGSLTDASLTVLVDRTTDPALGTLLLGALQAHGFSPEAWTGGQLKYPAVTYQLTPDAVGGHREMRWSAVVYDARGHAIARAESRCPECRETGQFALPAEQLAKELERLR